MTGDRFVPPCYKACDCNDDGLVDFADLVRILSFLYQMRDPPPPPGPFEAGSDPTEDTLKCER